MTSMPFVSAIIALLVCGSMAGNFRGAPKLKLEDIEASFLAEFADGIGKKAGAGVQRLGILEAELRPLYASVPKEADGTLGHNVVRYVLQRLFARRHGWYIRGLELGNGSAAVDDVSDTSLQEWVPDYLQGFLEKMIGGRGVNLRELAVFAATLEDLVHREEEGHLAQAYATHAQSTMANMGRRRAFDVLQTYMMIYMQGGNWTAQMAADSERLKELFAKKVSHWADTMEWLEQLLKNSSKPQDGINSEIDFKGARNIVSQIGDRYGAFNEAECGRLKAELVSVESAKPGRVRLADFYKRGLNGAWEFNEKTDFLRDIGTLDESDPRTPLVILPNYVQARTNCLSVSDLYAVCCKNECEGLMERLEAEVVNSTARPGHIAKVVSKLSSDTIAAPRELPEALMQRLQAVAARNHGEVPLHGRLFALWMHHAFPRECPYPHAAGTVKQLTSDEWMLSTGQADHTATKEEMLQEVASATCRLLPKGMECDREMGQVASEQGGDDDELPWDVEEELLVVRSPPQVVPAARRRTPLAPVHDAVNFLGKACLIYGLVWVLKSTALGRRLSTLVGLPPSSASVEAEKCCV